MDKAGIIIQELQKIRVRYLGLTLPMRQTILNAMEEYAKIKNKPIARVLVTGNCRKTHGVEEAFNKACEKLKENYMMFTETPINKDVTWTIELNVSKE